MKILILGTIGSGKTTQAKLVSQKLKFNLVKAGELLRNKAQNDEKLRNQLDAGVLVGDNVVGELVKKEIEEKKDENFIVDGYARRLSQLKVYDPNFDKVVFLKVGEEEIKKRLLKRGRSDDTKEVIEQRLKIYQQDTLPVIDYYKNLGKLVEVDGMGKKDWVTDRILEALGLK